MEEIRALEHRLATFWSKNRRLLDEITNYEKVKEPPMDFFFRDYPEDDHYSE